MTKSEALKKYSYPLCLGGLFTIAFFLRVYRLGELPNVLFIDEASVGYNAWCLANYGVDRYLNQWPIYAQNYAGGQSPLYIYSLTLLIRLFSVDGLTPAFVRIPALLVNMIMVICSAKLLSMLFHNRKITLAGTALMTFCPFFIMSGRFGLDCNMMLGISILAITLLFHYLQKSTWPALLLCGAGFALVLYTYALSYVVLPIFLVTLSLYMLYTKRISFGRLLVLAGEIFILALPLILFVICLVFELPGFRIFGVSILPIASERMSDLTASNFWYDFFNIIKVTLTSDTVPMNTVDKFYTMYVISIPFIAIGFAAAMVEFIRSLRKRQFTDSAVFLLFGIAETITIGLSMSDLVSRANAIFVSYFYFCIVGIRRVLHFLHRYRRAFKLVVCAGYTVWTVAFLRYYFTMYSVADMYPYPNSMYFAREEDALDRLIKAEDVKTVYIDCFIEEYLYFYYPVSPYEKDKADPTGGMRQFFTNVNYYTPIERASIYMVRKENRDFIMQLQNSGLPYESEEFSYYYVFQIP